MDAQYQSRHHQNKTALMFVNMKVTKILREMCKDSLIPCLKVRSSNAVPDLLCSFPLASRGEEEGKTRVKELCRENGISDRENKEGELKKELEQTRRGKL